MELDFQRYQNEFNDPKKNKNINGIMKKYGEKMKNVRLQYSQSIIINSWCSVIIWYPFALSLMHAQFCLLLRSTTFVISTIWMKPYENLSSGICRQ